MPWLSRDATRLAGWLVVWICMIGGGQAQTNDPMIEAQPSEGIAAVGETFTFSATAGGTTPFAYQWYFNSASIASATNSTLLLTNLATGAAGGYFVVVTNSAGSITSRVADLVVVTTPPRVVWVKDVAASGSGHAEVPLVLNANGRESSVQFSLRFDTNSFSTPTYDWAPGNSVTVISSNMPLGGIGFMVSRPFPEMFPVGRQTLGSILFSVLGTNTALDGGLLFTNQPVAIQAGDTNGLEMLLSAAVVPQVEVDSAQPKLNSQTGLFEQKVTVSNPSAITFVNLPVYVPSLGVDTSANEVSFFNASGSSPVDLNGDGSNEVAAFFTVANLTNGAVEVVTNSFYVTDHATAPVADYYVGVGGAPGIPMPATLVPLRVTHAAFQGDSFMMAWPTRPDRVYSVHYAGSLTDLANPGTVQVSTNTVMGTGSPANWMDGAPAEISRFYQVVESQ